MDNPEKLATCGTQDEDKTKNTTQKTQKTNNTDLTKNPGVGVKSGAREE